MSTEYKINLPDVIAKHYEAMAKKDGKTVPDLIVGELTSKSIDLLLEEAVEQAKKMKARFCLKELFADWDTIPKGQKLALGRSFYDKIVNQKAVPKITDGGKDSANMQFYDVSK